MGFRGGADLGAALLPSSSWCVERNVWVGGGGGCPCCWHAQACDCLASRAVHRDAPSSHPPSCCSKRTSACSAQPGAGRGRGRPGPGTPAGGTARRGSGTGTGQDGSARVRLPGPDQLPLAVSGCQSARWGIAGHGFGLLGMAPRACARQGRQASRRPPMLQGSAHGKTPSSVPPSHDPSPCTGSQRGRRVSNRTLARGRSGGGGTTSGELAVPRTKAATVRSIGTGMAAGNPGMLRPRPSWLRPLVP